MHKAGKKIKWVEQQTFFPNAVKRKKCWPHRHFTTLAALSICASRMTVSGDVTLERFNYKSTLYLFLFF